MSDTESTLAARIIHGATIAIRNEYPELRSGEPVGAAHIEFWNELIHRASGFLVRSVPLPIGFVDEAAADARRLQIGGWRAFRLRLEQGF
jgi:hypothetical protein